MKNSSLSVYVCGVIAMIFWGMSYVWSTQVFHYLNPTTTIFLRLVISCLFIGLTLLLFQKFEKIERKHIGLFALAALLEPFLYFIFESYGLLNASPIISSTIIATIPLFTPIVAYFVLKEEMTGWNIVGFIVSFLGVFIMLLNKEMELTASTKGLVFLSLAVAVALCYSIALKRLTVLYKPLTVTLTQNIIGVIYFIPLVTIVEKTDWLPFIAPSANIAAVNSYIMPLLMLGMFASSIAYALWNYIFGKVGAAKANVYTNLIPVFTAIFSYLILKEEINVQKIIGIAIVITGLIFSQLKPKKNDNKQVES